MSSPNRNSLYVGVTSEIENRVYKHKNKIYPDGFSVRYNCIILVYYRHFESIEEAIAEEKRIKAGNRKQKERLIDSINPEWNDLSENIIW
jgi:putative endonuclease